MESILVTIFRDIHTTTEPLFQDVAVVLKLIKDGTYKTVVEQVRSESDKDKRNNLKKRLASICFSGRFHSRKASALLEHSGLMCIDIDDLDIEKIPFIKEKISKNEYCHAVFISPSGNGIKVLVKIPDNKSFHKPCFLALEKYFKKEFEVEIDKSGKDVGRVCFASYDPDLYYSPDSEIWHEIIEEKIEKKDIKENKEIIARLEVWIKRQEIYQNGSRNTYLTKLVHAFCRYGIPKDESYGYVRYQYSDYPENETKSMIDSIYRGGDFATQTFTADELSGKKKIENIENFSKNITEFWIINDKGKVTIDSRAFLDFVEANGFGVFRYKSDPNKTFFVRSENMIVDFVGVKDIKDCVLEFVLKQAPEPVFDELQNKNRYFESTYLNALKEIKVEQIRDKKDIIYFFFDGFYYEVTKEKISKKSYPSLKGKHIWRSQICKKQIKNLEPIDDASFNNFVLRASTGSKEWKNNEKIDRYNAVVRNLGYGMHTFKKMSETKLVYYCDDSIGEIDGHAEGGTGKNLIQHCLKYARNVVSIGGKDFDKRDKFKFQTVDIETQIVVFDDYEGDTKELFTKITGDFGTESKGMKSEMIPFEESPKMFISSNTAPVGVSNSFKRRLALSEISDYYGAERNVRDDFGSDFFGSDWTQKDWDQMYSFLFHCAKEYLTHGITTYKSDNITFKQLHSNTNPAFVMFIEDNVKKVSGVFYNVEKFYQDYLFVIETEKERVTKQKFLSFCRSYCKIFGLDYQKKGKYIQNSELSFV